MSKIAVTGGAGFIASHVVDAYIALGHEVVVIDNLSTGNRKNLNPKAVFYEADICDEDALRVIFEKEKPEIVNHHAAQVSVTESEKDPARTEAVNYRGTVNLLAQSAVKRFIFASTGGAMFADPSQLPASEQTPAEPLSPYGKSKLAAEQAVVDHAKRSGFSYVILRYSNVFGPRQYPHGESGVIAIFSELATAGGAPTIYNKEATRDYVYVGDVAKANVLALTKGSGIYNIATGKETKNQHVFETIRDAFGWKAQPRYENARPGELFRSVLDITKAKTELGWQPTVTLQEGVLQLAALKS